MITYEKHGVKYTRERDTVFTEPVWILWETTAQNICRGGRPLRGEFWIWVKPGTDVEPLVNAWNEAEHDTTFEVGDQSED